MDNSLKQATNLTLLQNYPDQKCFLLGSSNAGSSGRHWKKIRKRVRHQSPL